MCVQALPGSASHLTALALRELGVRGRGASALSWGQLRHMPQLVSLSLDINFSEAGQPSLALETLTRLTRLRLQAARRSRAPPRLVRSVLLAAPLSLRRLELHAIDVLLGEHWWPQLPQGHHLAHQGGAEGFDQHGAGSEEEVEDGAQLEGQQAVAEAAALAGQPAAVANGQPAGRRTYSASTIRRCLARLEALELGRCHVSRDFQCGERCIYAWHCWQGHWAAARLIQICSGRPMAACLPCSFAVVPCAHLPALCT